ncbi:PD-(D/E)XK nuclease family protein [Pseudomonas fontis]|uniref:PD-(D/E)XK nuclease family protein n=1 Tax=Pseudomonas fontis TaxID=2942633 RepID=A0ABT5NXB1_9PSED|nr:PD-(D/E)XK nuclease family protein [Pseudomonas fontis]MDD0975611.1 PD-(D/E)XK nuclease family protein [Pseudomonas fontis]MDD0992807.1 PD-(D/E)XK nuclease family protein [Pseudomonas fontis]
MDNFFNTLSLLRKLHYRPPGFNLFSILRRDTDEVRLHSRFLAYLLDPKSSHNKGVQLLDAFLQNAGISDFSLEGISVQAEYQNIDILVRNTVGQALLIENKINAGDQPEQLIRYVRVLQREATDIRCIYLTLHGTEPSDQSRQGLDVQLLSYETHIIDWLNQCIALVIRAPSLREGIFQYIELLQKLTASDQGEDYMQKLKEQLLKGEHLLLINDIQQAYKEVLIDLQLDLWERMLAYQTALYPDMGTPSQKVSRAEVRDYYYLSRNNRYYGLAWPFNTAPGGVAVEIGQRLFHGVYCNHAEHPEAHQTLKKLLNPTGQTNTSAYFPWWTYANPQLNLTTPSNEDLQVLRDSEGRALLARSIIDELHTLWTNTRKALDG